MINVQVQKAYGTAAIKTICSELLFLRMIKKIAPQWCELVKACVPRGLARETKLGKEC
jgi:hypothetical protein